MMATIKQMSEIASKKARSIDDAKMAKYVWSYVLVGYKSDYRGWVVFGVSGNHREVLASRRLKSEAIDEARLYAFDTSCGPMRAPVIWVETKAGQPQKSIYAGEVK